MEAANSTLIKLFQEKDPLALAEPGRLLPSDDLQFNEDLAQSRLAIKARRTAQNQFPKAYAARTAAAEVSKQREANLSATLESQRKQLEKMKSEMSALKAQQKRLDGNRGKPVTAAHVE